MEKFQAVYGIVHLTPVYKMLFKIIQMNINGKLFLILFYLYILFKIFLENTELAFRKVCVRAKLVVALHVMSVNNL